MLREIEERLYEHNLQAMQCIEIKSPKSPRATQQGCAKYVSTVLTQEEILEEKRIKNCGLLKTNLT